MKDYQKKTPLMYCFNKNNCKLLIEAGADIDMQDAVGKTALMHANNE